MRKQLAASSVEAVAAAVGLHLQVLPLPHLKDVSG